MEKKAIVVWGPPTIDWLHVRHEEPRGSVRRGEQANADQQVCLSAQAGGVALLVKLLREMSGGPDTNIICSKKVGELATDLSPRATKPLPVNPLNGIYRHTWSVWAKRGKESKRGEVTKKYRMESNGVANWELERDEELDPEWQDKIRDLPGRTLLILDDPRQTKNLLWLENYLNKDVTEIILRVDSRSAKPDEPLMLSELIDKLEQHHANKTTIVTSIPSLRANGMRIGTSLSWERMFDDIVRAVEHCFMEGRRFHRVITTIGMCGVVLVDHSGKTPRSTLVFDRIHQEGDITEEHDGRVLGVSTSLMAALATAWDEQGTIPWEKAVIRGLEMIRALGENGYDLYPDKPKNSQRQELEFPLELVRRTYYRREVEAEHGPELGVKSRGKQPPKEWTLLNAEKIDDQVEIAKKIVREGVSVLKDVPVAIVEKWFSADRTEIEGVRSVQNAIRDYRRNHADKKPLSIAVFGPPGAGKSFVVKQIADQLGLKPDSQRTFNLSQFESPTELAQAFHQIQDVTLRGQIPLVFWDEFDSAVGGQPLGWLRYFLAPMQDAEFTDRGAVHPVGRGIYIFAGGTSHSFKEFSKKAASTPPAGGGKVVDDKTAKRPDFVSRLRAYIDVKGPNRAGDGDKFHMIRRAFLLRGILLQHENKVMRVEAEAGVQIMADEAVLNAFLLAKGYKHGSRSLDAVVALSSFKNNSKYQVSSLPPEHLLAMHIEKVDDFMHDLAGGKNGRE